jgi:tetratricopeptide (TPR) repeat protein
VIMRKNLNGMAIILAALALTCLPARSTAAGSERLARTAAAQQAAAQPSYTLPEYNAEQAAQTEKDPQARIKLLDAFVAQFPNSTLMQYVYQFYYQTYYALKNYAKAIEYADKLIAMGDKADLAQRVSAIQARVQLYPLAVDAKAPDLHDQATKERDAALLGVKLFPDLQKAPGSKVTDDQVKAGTVFLEAAAGTADLQLKDNAAAIDAFKAALAINAKDPVINYRLGVASFGTDPPQALDGFWYLGRAIDLKIPDDSKVKDYLRSRILAYEQPGCDNQVDAQLDELLQLAQNSTDRPATYTIPSHDDLTKISQASTIITVITDLSGGGDKAKDTWLAICGAEFPEVVGKIVDAQKSDNFVDFMVFTSASSDEMQAATMANMDVKVWTAPKPADAAPAAAPAGADATPVPPQPDVLRMSKDDPIRFSGMLIGYDPAPFLLHWDQVKVDPTTIPDKGAAPGKKAAPKKAAPKPSGN